ncbi:YbhB/YbcL family Raf kinase inhibitor-like protein [Candidatus Pacearchaeota archaeon]|nr:YbhB/YbcL family Raf kinase inhibitor-like protein [Candidatus Pacearchaeota archaeon]
MKLTSPAFANNGRIPEKYTCEGLDINPPLEILGVPNKAKSLVLIMDDPNAPVGTWDHWFVFNINPETTKIQENSIPQGASQGINSWKNQKYGGPCPPLGVHRYKFKLYVLDVTLTFSKAPNKSAIESAMQDHILEQTTLTGLYSRK